MPFPEGVSVVFLPPEDRGHRWLVEANLRIARKQAAGGKTVWIWTIGSRRATVLDDYEAVLTAEPKSRQKSGKLAGIGCS